MHVIIFRKDSEVSDFPSKGVKTTLEAILTVLTAKLRFKRPTVTAFFLPSVRGRSAFARLTPVTRADLHHLADCRRNGVLTPEAKTTLSRGWIVPDDEVGRKPKNGERDWESAAQSILIFAKDRIGDISADHGVYTVDPNGSDISVTLCD